MIPSVVAQELRDTVFDYLRTTFSLADDDFETALFDFLGGGKGLFKGPYVDIRLPFRKRSAADAIPLDIKPDFEPYQHQVKAFQRLYSREGHQPQHTLVTTGTGSGKTECFLYPILDHCWRNQDSPGIKAIILYPMNALATDQAGRLAEILWNDERLKGNVSAGLYVGGTGRHAVADENHLIDQRDVLRDSPPDILLTNYKMLDFLLMRPEDKRLWRHNQPDSLRYLVLDELHTYDGAQGTDVACLLRRLKSRLQVTPGSLCCIGTSATIGSPDERSAAALTAFASKVFDALFAGESVITEARQPLHEVLSENSDQRRLPLPDSRKELDPETYGDSREWLARQIGLWLERPGDSDPVVVAQALRSDPFLRQLLRVAGDGPQSLEQLDHRLLQRDPEWSAIEDPQYRGQLLNSFLGVVSYAKDKDGDRLIPFLTVQLQVWMRELRHLVQKVAHPSEGYEFSWASDHRESDESETHWLPIAYCRECGQHGLATAMRAYESTALEDLSEIGRSWIYRTPAAKYLRMGEQASDLFPSFLSPISLSLGSEASTEAPDGRRVDCIPVLLEAELSTQVPPRFLARCPDCGSDQSLSMLGSRAPSLLSVTVSDLFTSRFNDDKKLLAFTDSVQDASHRAGFFGARTYRFNVRTAIQALVEYEASIVPLPEYAERMLAYWSERKAKRELIPTLLPPDLRDLPSYLAFLEAEGKGNHRRLEDDLADRLGWEVTMEYGLRTKVGRTLEATRCSTASFDQEQLQAAARQLCLELNEERILEGLARAAEVQRAEHFLSGLLHRTRTRGGVFHPFLLGYIKGGGNRFLLRKAKQPLLSPFGRYSVLPRFLTDHLPKGKQAQVFDAVVSSTTTPTWLRDWVARCFEVPIRDPGCNEFVRRALSALVGAGILKEFDAKSKSKVWGIDPDALRITFALDVVECATCGTTAVIASEAAPIWVGQVCTRYRCEGTFELQSERQESYYSRIYRSGQLHRVFPSEHTGLLTRTDREDIEEAFRTQSRPDGPNMLVATPTLEMGIDIGDLSSLVLCSVPPTTANYLQRVGRAGRKTGNALCLTIANHRPHDLYFYEAPEEMMSGAVLPPGCFLDTPEMLKRQMVAHGMDAWSREDESAASIPRQVRYIKDTADATKFPGRFVEFYRKERQALTQEFLRRFKDELNPENAEILEGFGVSDAIPESIITAFERVRLEREELRKTRDRIRDQIATLEKNRDEEENVDERIEELKSSRRVLARLIDEQDAKYPLNVLTDEGVLPNYAFPEAGVTLDSVIRDRKDDGNSEYSSREFIRPASSALRELAPLNTFYAEGRKVQIDEIDMGSPARPLTESWRLCAECNYSERLIEGGTTAIACPRCGDRASWSDAGQVRTLVNFRRSRSLAARLEASTVDDSEDREEEFYRTADIIDVARENCFGAKLIPDLPFGFELLRDLNLREINFGRETDGGQGLRVAGMPIGDRGFEVCLDCGKVKAVGATDIEHAPYCRTRRTKRDPRIDSVFLYRQVQSEAIRVLLPFAEVKLKVRRASFKAALELGFRRHFQGNPVHLQIKETREPVPGGGYRQFLVVFDAVPGGTGYLSELWRSANFMDVLQLALTALQTCQCQKEAGRDGCYRCIFAYQRQRELDLISSREAQQTLTQILSRASAIEPVHTLSNVSLDRRLESELEDKFIAALSERAAKEKGCSWKETVQGGELRWRLTINGYDWEIRPQVQIGKRHGVTIASQPDFLIRSTSAPSGARPIAVFCDGFAFHACPDRPLGRIWDDLEKREALLRSGNYWQWSVGWKDVESFEGTKGETLSLIADTKSQLIGRLATAIALTLPKNLGSASNMEMLWAFLSQPDPQQWRRLGDVWTNGWVSTPPFSDSARVEALVDEAMTSEVLNRHDLVTVAGPSNGKVARVHWTDHSQVIAIAKAADLQGGSLGETSMWVRLDDSPANRRQHEFEGRWRAFLHALNLMQFRRNCRFETTERIMQTGGTVAEADEEVPKVAEEIAEYGAGASSQLAELIEFSPSSVHPLLTAVAEHQLPLPTMDFELDLGDGRCGPQPELCWPDMKLALLADNQLEDRETFESRGWKVITHPLEVNAVLDTLRG